MSDPSNSKLFLETIFVELNALSPQNARANVSEAMAELSFNATLEDSVEDENEWRIGRALEDPVRESRYGIEIFPPQNETTSPGRAWTWAHAISEKLACDASAEPTFGGDIVQAPDEPAQESSSSGNADEPPPNDVRWHHSRIRLKEAHARFDDLDIEPGEGVLIGHPDTGYTKHPDIVDSLDINRGLNLLEKGKKPKDPRKGGFLEQPGHGTSTGSMIVAADAVSLPRKKANGKKADIFGVAPGAKLVPIRVTESVIIAGWQRRLALAIEHAVDSGCHVISMSLGGIGGSRLNRAIEHAEAKGVILVAAAGNNVGFVVAPATHPLTVACAASDISDKPWSGSSEGEAVTITAPGHNVWVAGFAGNTPIVRPGSGTSHATATVAGAAALWLSAHRQALTGSKSRIPRLFRSALRRSAKSVASLPPSHFGAGLLDCDKLVATGPSTDESVAETRGLGRPESVALRSFIAPTPMSESAMQGQPIATMLMRELDSAAMSELLFHLSVDAELRSAWNRLGVPSSESTTSDEFPMNAEFSPRLRSQLRRARAAVQDVPSGPPEDSGTAMTVATHQAVDAGTDNSIDIQIRLNLKITVEIDGVDQ